MKEVLLNETTKSKTTVQSMEDIHYRVLQFVHSTKKKMSLETGTVMGGVGDKFAGIWGKKPGHPGGAQI